MFGLAERSENKEASKCQLFVLINNPSPGSLSERQEAALQLYHSRLKPDTMEATQN